MSFILSFLAMWAICSLMTVGALLTIWKTHQDNSQPKKLEWSLSIIMIVMGPITMGVLFIQRTRIS